MESHSRENSPRSLKKSLLPLVKPSFTKSQPLKKLQPEMSGHSHVEPEALKEVRSHHFMQHTLSQSTGKTLFPLPTRRPSLGHGASGHYLMMVRSSCCTAKMGRYCLCSKMDFFFANSLLASLFSFM